MINTQKAFVVTMNGLFPINEHVLQITFCTCTNWLWVHASN